MSTISTATTESAVATPPRRDRRWPPVVPLAVVTALVLCAILAPLLHRSYY